MSTESVDAGPVPNGAGPALFRCSKCRVEKPSAEFDRNAARPNGLNNQCRPCRHDNYHRGSYGDVSRRNKVERYANDAEYRERHKAESRIKRYGLIREAYDAMHAAQDGVCYVCGGISPRGMELSVDHDHETGQVRKLLCLTCNTAVGMARDNPALLRALADYLDEHR